VRNGMTLVLLGAGAGLLGAAALARVLRDQLYGVRAGDPLTYGAVLVAVVAAGLAASWLPARRAAHVDPQLALRGD
jgi:putative ABC transport system permease protein